MELEQNMASLVINDKKKRRLSGVLKPHKFAADATSSESDSDESDLEAAPIDQNQAEPRRSLRKKIRKEPPEKRRVLTKPKKSEDEVESYYLDKRVKRLPPSLETIFEEPQLVKSQEVLMSTRKFKRVINFSASAKNATKIKKRKMKAKSVSAKKRIMKKVSLELLIQKLSGLEDEN